MWNRYRRFIAIQRTALVIEDICRVARTVILTKQQGGLNATIFQADVGEKERQSLYYFIVSEFPHYRACCEQQRSNIGIKYNP